MANERKSMRVTKETILFAMRKLLDAGSNFGHDCPEEILWELEELEEQLTNPVDVSIDEQSIMEEISNLKEFYQ